MGHQWRFLLIFLSPVLVTAITITEISTETLFKAKGETTMLACTYVLDPTESGTLDIEWAVMNPDPAGLDTVILTYMGNQIIKRGSSELQQRLQFTATDPSQGDASITISYVEVKDSATYQCKVKKNPGVASRKVTINVQERPAKTQCWVDGEQYQGRDVVLKCKPGEGSQPLTFKWDKIAGESLVVPPTLNLGSSNGDLLIRNLSKPFAGTYKCAVVNNVGHDECTVVLSAESGNRAGIIAAAVIGAILLLLLILLLIWCLICCCNRRRYEKEIENDIREDVVAPPSNNNSRASSIRTALGYRSHNINYSMRKIYNLAPREEATAPPVAGSFRPPSHSYENDESVDEPAAIQTMPGPTRLSPYNISRIGGVPVMVPAQAREGFIV